MRTLPLTIAIPFLILSSLPTFGMIPPFTQNSDLNKKIYDDLSPEDKDDCRLVCKKWAFAEPNLDFMPDSIEKQYDLMIKKTRHINRTFIFFNLIYKNDLNAVKWLSYGKRKNAVCIDVSFLDILRKPFTIDMTMIPIHNKNREMLRFLYNAHPDYNDQNWKTYHKTITAPQELQQCLCPSHDRDFSFIPYIIAVLSDDFDKLKQLYAQKIPTKNGQFILLDICAKPNAFKCLNFLLTNKEAQQILKENENCRLFVLLQRALEYNHPEIVHALIKSKLYVINETRFRSNSTLLDQYNWDNTLKNRENAIIFLKSLGAKTREEIEQEKKCIIQ